MTNDLKDALIVGIGASAGGLEALKAFASAIPETPPMVFIVVQHLAPDHESLLPSLLAKECKVPVTEAKQGDAIELGHLYVIPPNKLMEVNNNTIELKNRENQLRDRHSVDHLFRSLAQAYGSRCAGLIVSGTGNDGTAGLRAIKDEGGLTLAQNPNLADYPGMPESAINDKGIDKIIDPREAYTILKHYLENDCQITEEDRTRDDTAENLREIGAILKANEDFNLQEYKIGTVMRRITRRISLKDIGGLPEYADILRDNASERHQLTQDLLINVTAFFRDPAAFEILAKKIIPELFDQFKHEESLRVWIAGCATGEEAYSIAMLLLDHKTKNNQPIDIKVFATDIDEEAIRIARKAVYPTDIEKDIPKQYFDKYLYPVDHNTHFRIRPQVRDLISFAVQNVVSDPPFGRMHFICCRNLLIYLNKPIQEKVNNAFYFALKQGGYLFLGSSETLGPKEKAFDTLSKQWRLFRKTSTKNDRRASVDRRYGDKTNQNTPTSRDPQPARQASKQKTRQEDIQFDDINSSILKAFMPPAVVVDSDGKVVYNHGDWRSFMAIETGEPQSSIVQLVLPPLRSRLRSALYKLNRTGDPIVFKVNFDEHDDSAPCESVKVRVALLNSDSTHEKKAIGILFEKIDGTHTDADTVTRVDEKQANLNLEQELADTKEELQNTIEELETSSEELKAAHEESLSTNEELQSANEELEANSEELRSLNEELNTVNAQLKDKLQELQIANNDVENFFASTQVPTLFLDPALTLQRYTPAAAQLMKLGNRDINNHLSRLDRNFIDEELVNDCEKVLRTFQPISTDKLTQAGRHFLRHITPYTTSDRRVEGVVVVFQDVTDLKILSERAERRERQQAIIAKLGMQALKHSNPHELLLQATRQVQYMLESDFCHIKQYQPDKNQFLMIAGIGWQEGLVGSAVTPADHDSQAGYTLNASSTVIMTDSHTENRFRIPELFYEHGIVSGISCVINYDNAPFGILGAYSKKKNWFSEDDVHFVMSVANMLSTVLRTKEHMEELTKSREQLHTIVNSISQMAWMADEKGQMHWFNDRWFEYTGLSEHTSTTEAWQNCIHPEEKDKVISQFESHITRNLAWEDTFRMRGQSGDFRWFLARATPITSRESNAIRWFGTHTDISDRLRDEGALKDSQQKLRLAMETSKTGSFEYYFNEERTYWDDQLKKIWGVSEKEVPTQDIFWQGVHPDDRELVQQSIEHSLDPKSIGRYHVVYRVVNRYSGNLTWVEASGKVYLEDGKPVKMVGMIIDVTDRKLLENSLTKAVEELQVADQKKNEFLSILGHELRNPLAALGGTMEILKQRVTGEEKLFGVMGHSIRTMSKLLDDLLDLKRVSQNTIQLSSELVDVHDILHHVIDAVQPTLKTKEHILEADIEKDLFVLGDDGRLEQIFSNLIINAYKYTPHAGKINIRAERKDKNVIVQVSDNGVGLRADSLESIFNPFVQISQASEALSGLGIGLALSKQLTELHHGKIWAESAGEYRGATFIVELPWVAGEKAIQTTEKPSESNPIEANHRVLLIEDNPDILETFPILMASIGCTVETAARGIDGIKLAEKFKPDAIFVDIGLPDMTGHAVAKLLRSAGFNGLLVALSGYSHKEIKEQSIEAGFDLHLAKPASLQRLAEVLENGRPVDENTPQTS